MSVPVPDVAEKSPDVPKKPFPMTMHKATVLEPEDFAYYVHCWCGMEPEEFITWLRGELELLDAIDPFCDK